MRLWQCGVLGGTGSGVAARWGRISMSGVAGRIAASEVFRGADGDATWGGPRRAGRSCGVLTMDHSDATDQRGVLGEDEMNMWSSVFCSCLERCESIAKGWESRALLSGTRGPEQAAATSHRYGRGPKTLAPAIELGQLFLNLAKMINENTLV